MLFGRGNSLLIECNVGIRDKAVQKGDSLTKQELDFIKQLYINYYYLESEGLEFSTPTNIAERMCDTLASGHFTLQDVIDAPTLVDLQRIIMPWGRHCCKLYTNVYRHGTVEFREHVGTTNSHQIYAWLALVDHMVGVSKDMVKEVGAPTFPNECQKTSLFKALSDFYVHTPLVAEDASDDKTKILRPLTDKVNEESVGLRLQGELAFYKHNGHTCWSAMV
tara:strand:+ start:393 stop:1055 length:663 start_codon:yes stop_codon:yes gene_type:complete